MEIKPAEGASGPLDRHGPARAVFAANLGFFDLVVSTLGIALLGAGLLAVGAWLLYVLHVQSRGGSSLLLALALALAGLLLLASAVAAGGRAWRMRNARVLVYPDGLIFRRGRQALEIRWDKVRDVLQGIEERHEVGAERLLGALLVQRDIRGREVDGLVGIDAADFRDLLGDGLVDRLVIFQTPLSLGEGGIKPFPDVESLDIQRIVERSRFGDDEMTVYALNSK